METPAVPRLQWGTPGLSEAPWQLHVPGAQGHSCSISFPHSSPPEADPIGEESPAASSPCPFPVPSVPSTATSSQLCAGGISAKGPFVHLLVGSLFLILPSPQGLRVSSKLDVIIRNTVGIRFTLLHQATCTRICSHAYTHAGCRARLRSTVTLPCWRRQAPHRVGLS